MCLPTGRAVRCSSVSVAPRRPRREPLPPGPACRWLLGAACLLAAGDTGRAETAWRGDARLRAERQTDGGTASDLRLRCRFRWEADWVHEDGWAAGVGIGSGLRGDPRVPDTVIGDGRADPTLRLNLAWAQWRPGARGDLTVTAGRLRMPMMAVQDLLFDGDWNPVGASARWESADGAIRLHGRAGAFLLADMGDPGWRFHALQGAIEWRREMTWRLLGGASFYFHEDARGRRLPLPAAGNTLLASGRLAEDFHVVEGFGQATWDPWLPLTIYGQAAINAAASRERVAWLAGVSAGRARAVGGVDVGWNYRRVEADATPSSLSDSDFGGTDIAGHRVYARWQPVRNVWLALTWIHARRDRNGADERRELWQADLQTRF